MADSLKMKQAKAIRIQRKRTKGWKMPDNTVYVGRPTKWGNPYVVAKNPKLHPSEWRGNELENISDVLMAYEGWLKNRLELDRLDINELKGKNLACWCALDSPCHADVLLKIANQ